MIVHHPQESKKGAERASRRLRTARHLRGQSSDGPLASARMAGKRLKPLGGMWTQDRKDAMIEERVRSSFVTVVSDGAP